MNLLIKGVEIVDIRSSLNGKRCDLYIEDNRYKKIAGTIAANQCKSDTIVFEATGKKISIGWLDMRANFREPGHEQKELISSGQRAAAYGGYTGVVIMPSTSPPLSSRSDIEYVISKSKNNVTDVYPCGCLTVDRQGKEITEMYDMQNGGAVAFTDDKRFIKDSGVMLRALQYAGSIGSHVLIYCDDTGLSGDSSANESANTTLLGFKGSPSIAEEVALLRDITLGKYAGVPVHVSGISSREAIGIIRTAKKQGIQVTCEVNAHHLLLSDDMLGDFDSNYKVKPPLRSIDDVASLCEAVADNTIDVIVSDHSPHDSESKNVEWDFADFGIIGLESAFSVINTALRNKIPADKLIEKITVNPRKILGIPIPAFTEGELANFTIFDPDIDYIFTKKNIKSLSSNTPFLGKQFTGKAIAVFNNGLFVKSSDDNQA